MAELGLMGMTIPEEYGGAGTDTVSDAIAVEEPTRVDSSVAITMAAHHSLGTLPIYLFGSEEQKREWVPELASGEKLAAFGLTEPEAGSDAGAARTRAELRDGEWVVNGSKMFITNAGTDITACVTITAVTGEDEISNIVVLNGAGGLRDRAADAEARLAGIRQDQLKSSNGSSNDRQTGPRRDAVRRAVRRSCRRQGRDRHPDARGGPVRPADPGLRGWPDHGRRRGDQLPDPGVPVELDRIYASLQTLTQALGPNGVNADGTLEHLLKAGKNAFEGQGARGNAMLRELSAAAKTFGDGAGPLFDTVTHLAEFTERSPTTTSWSGPS